MRLEELYKGQGRITYTGVGIGGANYNIYRIVYDANEDGYNNRWIQLRSAILVLMRLLAMCQQKIPYEVF
jgi:hypothetical protein